MAQALEEILQFVNEEPNVKKLEPSQIAPYLAALNKRLQQLATILTRERNAFVVPHLSTVRRTIDCLVAKHALEGQDGIDFGLTIDPTNSGFPTTKDFYLLEKNKQEAQKVIEQLRSRKAVIDMVRDAILKERPTQHALVLLRRYDYYSRLQETKLLEEYKVNDPVIAGDEKGRRSYIVEWTCIEGHTNVPTFYRMYLEQDANALPFERCANDLFKTIIYTSKFGIIDPRTLVSEVDENIDELHPKLIEKYVIGPFHNQVTLNSDALNALLADEEDKSILRFSTETVVSEGVRKKLGQGFWASLFGREIEKEIYGPVDTKCMMIVPFHLKQRLSDRDERGNPCKIYGVTLGGDIVG